MNLGRGKLPFENGCFLHKSFFFVHDVDKSYVVLPDRITGVDFCITDVYHSFHSIVQYIRA